VIDSVALASTGQPRYQTLCCQNQKERNMKKIKTLAVTGATAILLTFGMSSAMAYDGTKCKASGNCWEAKPGFPEKIKGSKFDPKHSQTELDKQTSAMEAMEARNAKRVENFKQTGKWSY
jgi:methanol dehydrogenase (cytochrome c) subunit 2